VVTFDYKEGAEKVTCTEARNIIRDAYTSQQKDAEENPENPKGPWEEGTKAEHLDPSYLVLRY